MSRSEAELDEALLPIPKVNVDRNLATARTIETAIAVRVGEVITETMALRWATLLMGLLQCPDVDVLTQTLFQYVGRTVDRRFARLLSLQLVGRERELALGPLVAYDRPVRAEWIALEIRKVTPCIWQDKRGARDGADLSMLVLSGHPAGHILLRKFPESWLNGFAYEVAFNRRLNYDGDIRHFIGMRFLGYLQPQEGQELVFVEWWVPEKLRKYNREIAKLRSRFDTDDVECPREFEHPCFDCPVKRADCQGSIHFDI